MTGTWANQRPEEASSSSRLATDLKEASHLIGVCFPMWKMEIMVLL